MAFRRDSRSYLGQEHCQTLDPLTEFDKLCLINAITRLPVFGVESCALEAVVLSTQDRWFRAICKAGRLGPGGGEKSPRKASDAGWVSRFIALDEPG
jgi:hypothetical protein